MDFGSNLRLLSCMFVPNFDSISYVTLVLEPETPPKVWRKSGLSQKRLKCGKKYFTWLYVLTYPFVPINPLLAAMSVFFLFFFLFFRLFFFLDLVPSSSSKPQSLEL